MKHYVLQNLKKINNLPIVYNFTTHRLDKPRFLNYNPVIVHFSFNKYISIGLS